MRAVECLDLLDTPPEAEFDEAVRLAALICRTPVSLITVLDSNRQWFKAKVGVDVTETPREYAFCNHAVGRTSPLIIPDLSADVRFAQNPFVTGDPNVRFYAGIPLCAASGHTIGTLCVLDIEPRELSAEQETALSLLARQVSERIDLRARLKIMQELVEENKHIRAELVETNQRLRELSLTDSLTGLKNRLAFEEQLDREIAASAQSAVPFSILLVDIDFFKSFNDDFGHSTCDEILRTVARLLARSTRDTDLVARFGGEEFAIVLPETTEADAAKVAEELRGVVAAHRWSNRAVTVSIGVAAWKPLAATREAIIEAADMALYHAKVGGRNRIFAHECVGKVDTCA